MYRRSILLSHVQKHDLLCRGMWKHNKTNTHLLFLHFIHFSVIIETHINGIQKTYREPSNPLFIQLNILQCKNLIDYMIQITHESKKDNYPKLSKGCLI